MKNCQALIPKSVDYACSGKVILNCYYQISLYDYSQSDIKIDYIFFLLIQSSQVTHWSAWYLTIFQNCIR